MINLAFTRLLYVNEYFMPMRKPGESKAIETKTGNKQKQQDLGEMAPSSARLPVCCKTKSKTNEYKIPELYHFIKHTVADGIRQ